ncbi:hypothetical protein [Paucisalibacillus globulus]|uniref:hypothetical protein n=1 Tax=Bacillaceae TaxID=186817 RepID=UPI001596ADEB|nr:hypothetical protein [Paucisalibacillus globulus]
MWIVTRYIGLDITMYEFETEKEARKALKNIKGGYNILTEVMCVNGGYHEKRVA